MAFKFNPITSKLDLVRSDSEIRGLLSATSPVVYTSSTGVISFDTATTTLTAYLQKANNLSDLTSAAAARTNLGLVIGTDVQAYDATLQSISALGTAADKMLYTTGIDTWAESTITAAGRALLDDADAATMRTTLGLVAGGAGDIWVEKAGDTMTGKLYIGFSNVLTFNGSAVDTQLSVQSEAFSAIDQQTFSEFTTLGSASYHVRSRGTSAAKTVVQNGDYLYQRIIGGYDGTDYALGGYELWAVDDTPGSNDMPTSWSLWLTPNGSQTAANAVTIASTRISTWTSTMNIIPTTDINALTLKAFSTSTSIKTLSVLNSSNVEWFYLRKGLLSDANIGSEYTFTTSGTSGIFRVGFGITLSAGFTGSGFTGCLFFDNVVAGTNSTYTGDASVYGYRLDGNRGIGGYARAVTVGHNVGGLMLAGGGNNNYGCWGSATITKASAVNVGVFANAHNASGTSPAFIGLYATNYNASGVPPNMAGVKTALLADNQALTSDIALFRDNGASTWKLADGGNLTHVQTAQAAGATAFSLTPGAHTAVVAEVVDFTIAAHTMTITGGYTNQRFARLLAPTITAASALTVTTASTFSIAGAPIAAGSAVITNSLSFWVEAGTTRFSGRVQKTQGADVASANDLTLGADGNSFAITGTTQINAITIAGWQNGSEVTLLFASTPVVKHNTAGGGGTVPILLAGAVDFSATADDTLTLILSVIGGVQAFREKARTAI